MTTTPKPQVKLGQRSQLVMTHDIDRLRLYAQQLRTAVAEADTEPLDLNEAISQLSMIITLAKDTDRKLKAQRRIALRKAEIAAQKAVTV